MAKRYTLKFGSGDPRLNTGLSPTFLLFYTSTTGASTAAPAIVETLAGSGLYQFTYGPTAPIVFLADGGANLNSTDRYISAGLDPVQAVDEKIGTIDDSFGSTSADPTTLFGHAKRAQEFSEGNATFTKSTGIWDVYSRGSSTLLVEKTLTNSISAANKT